MGNGGRLVLRIHPGAAAPPVTIAGVPVTSAQVGTAYTGFTVTASGGVSPYTYSKVSGPSWMAVNSSTGAVTGTPDVAAITSCIIRVTDHNGNHADLSAFSVTVQAAGPPGPIVADQTIDFGALTLANAGAAYPANTGGVITSASITGGTLNGTGWTIAADGLLKKTSSNVSAGTLVISISNANASDTATITINPIANCYHFRSYAELTAALAAAKARDTTATYLGKCRDNVSIGNSGSTIFLNAYTFSGTMVDANIGAGEEAYDYSATGSFTGGSFEITADTAYSPQFSDAVAVRGCTGLIINGFRFTGVPTTDSYERGTGAGGISSTAAAVYYQLQITKNASFPAEPTVIVKNCQFGGNAVNGNVLRWGDGISADIANQLVIEDCSFDGFYKGIIVRSAKRAAVRRNDLQNQLVDGMNFLGTDSTTMSSFTVERLEVTSNTIWNLNTTNNYAASHSDGIQLGTSADTVPYDVFITKNYIFLTTPPNSYPGFTDVRGCQGIWINGNPVALNGIIAENFVTCTDPNALGLYTGAVNAKNNTFINDTLDAAPSGNSSRVARPIQTAGNHTYTNNVVSGTINFGGGTKTETGTATISATAASGVSTSYYQNFNGPFTSGTYGATYTIRTDTSAHVRADIASVFADAGASAGKGFLHHTVG